jgi:KAP family P-loop domain
MQNIPPISFDDFDCFQLRSFYERLDSYLIVENDYVEGSLVIALDAAFGSGKSTFLQMWQNEIYSRRLNDGTLPIPITINAWESDHCGDPFVAIVANLIDAIQNQPNFDQDKIKQFHEAAKDIFWFSTGLINDFIANQLGIDILKAGDLAEKNNIARKDASYDFVNSYRIRVAALNKLKCTMRDIFGGQSIKTIVFVDELDRCRPDYAVTYLETIKHIFDMDGIAFVIAIDYNQLSNSARCLFGKDLNPDEYFRKFFHRIIKMPNASETAYRMVASKYIDKYISIEGKRSTLINLNSDFQTQVVELCLKLKLNPRQIQEAFRLMGHIMQSSDIQKEEKIRWGVAAGTVLLSLLRVRNRNLFELILFDKNSEGAVKLCEELAIVLEHDSLIWWIKIIISGMSDYSKDFDLFDEFLLKMELSDGTQKGRYDFFNNFYGAFGSTRGLQQIANMFENLEKF